MAITLRNRIYGVKKINEKIWGFTYQICFGKSLFLRGLGRFLDSLYYINQNLSQNSN